MTKILYLVTYGEISVDFYAETLFYHFCMQWCQERNKNTMFKHFFTWKIRKNTFDFQLYLFIRHWNAMAWVIMDLQYSCHLHWQVFFYLRTNVQRNIEKSFFFILSLFISVVCLKVNSIYLGLSRLNIFLVIVTKWYEIKNNFNELHSSSWTVLNYDKANCENMHVLKKEEKSVFEFKQFIRWDFCFRTFHIKLWNPQSIFKYKWSR